MIAYLFPVSHEAALLRSHIHGGEFYRLQHLPCTTGTLAGKAVTVAELGMGASSATASLSLLLDHFNFTSIIVSGYAGALAPEFRHGDVLLLENFSSAGMLKKTSPSFRKVQGFTSPTLLSTREEKAELFQRTRASTVDMESAALHDWMESRNIPHLTCRAISDTAIQSLPAGALASAFDPSRNRPTPGRLITHLLRHPADLHPFYRFVEPLAATRRSLTAKLLELHTLL